VRRRRFRVCLLERRGLNSTQALCDLG